MNKVDYIIIAILLIWSLIGLKRGLLKSVVALAGFVLVIVLAYYLKDPLATLMYEKLPFFNIKGVFNGVTVINIIIYEAIAFLIVAGILGLLYRLIVSLTNILDKVINLVIFMGIPSKILGAVFGLAEGFVVVFIALFVSMQLNFHTKDINNSKYSKTILTSTPVLSNVVSSAYKVFMEIYDLRAVYENNKDYNEKAFDTLLKHKIISTKSARKLVELGKLKIDNAESIIIKYEENKDENSSL